MELIKIHHPYSPDQIPGGNVVLALGFFDGVHRGHQKVISRAKKIAEDRGFSLAVMTFNQHPSIVFKKINPDQLKYLSTVEKKEALMCDLGVDILYEVAFTSAFANLTPQKFVDEYIAGLHAKVVVAGFDYTYGRKEIASMEHLPKYAKKRFDVVVVEEQKTEQGKISSTRIRMALDRGDIKMVNELLGYTYEISGRVIHGDARGRLLGFPTANIETSSNIRLPGIGVYAVKVLVNGIWHTGIASIGHNVTFEPNRPLTVEVYILDFDQDIYGETVTIAWHSYLRNEMKFDSVADLIKHLEQDKENAIRYFEQSSLIEDRR